MSSQEPNSPGAGPDYKVGWVFELEEQNSRLQRLVAELLLKNQQLRNAYTPNQMVGKGSDQG